MIFLYCNKRLVFEFIWTSASTFNPHGSLSSTDAFYTKTDKEELQKVKVKNDILEFNNQKSWLFAFQLKTQSPWHLAKSPSRLLNVTMLEITILLLMELDPSHHNSSNPPGSACRAVCLLSSSLAQVTVKRGDLHPGHRQHNQTIAGPDAKSWSPIEEKLK